MYQGLPFLPSQRVARASALVFLLRATATTQMTRCMCRHSPPKQIMTSSEHHGMMTGIIWWCFNDVGDFGWWHLHQYWKGIEGRMHERVHLYVIRNQFLSTLLVWVTIKLTYLSNLLISSCWTTYSSTYSCMQFFPTLKLLKLRLNLSNVIIYDIWTEFII